MTEKSKPNDNSFWGGVACCAIAALAIWWFGIREETPKEPPAQNNSWSDYLLERQERQRDFEQQLERDRVKRQLDYLERTERQRRIFGK